jgi:phage gp46-like protein
MSPSQFNFQENELEEADVITLWDEQGRSLDCYIENAYETDDLTYMLLVPVDTPVMILAWDEESEEEGSDAFLIEDSEEIERIFADAKAVLAELDLLLKSTAHTLTVSGELPPLEEDNVLSLEIDSDEPSSSSEPEELQFLASFFSEDQKYSIYSPLAPLLFLGVGDGEGKVELVSPDDDGMGPILEELLFDELD